MESNHQDREPWNKGKLIGQKPPLKLKDIWAIRIHLQNTHQVRDLAMFNLAIDSKLRGCDLVNLRVRDVIHGSQILPRTMIVQRKTQHPVQFELTEPTRIAVAAWIAKANLKSERYLFPSRVVKSPHVSTRQYARIVHQWVAAVGLDTTVYGTHTMRRTKATLICSSGCVALVRSLHHIKESVADVVGGLCFTNQSPCRRYVDRVRLQSSHSHTARLPRHGPSSRRRVAVRLPHARARASAPPSPPESALRA